MYQFLPLKSLRKFHDWAGCESNPVKLDLLVADKTITSGDVIQCLRRINDVSNSNLVRNTDTFLSQKEVEVPETLRNKPFSSSLLILF